MCIKFSGSTLSQNSCVSCGTTQNTRNIMVQVHQPFIVNVVAVQADGTIVICMVLQRTPKTSWHKT